MYPLRETVQTRDDRIAMLTEQLGRAEGWLLRFEKLLSRAWATSASQKRINNLEIEVIVSKRQVFKVAARLDAAQETYSFMSYLDRVIAEGV